ncbi:TraR/DksA C4-type zinc finger protein [Sulfurovum sp.]|uniref:TraR/DksA C4-type zinc finger protein n=1 Tax=Sulfurovum sp. TaxID=1969726 RepID=UPI0025D3AF2A|nr:TraR/DksA C4-type zinc finger protein [Sulfurovum sp.]
MQKRNDLDLEKFKALLQEKQEKLEENIARLRRELAVKTERGGNDLEDVAETTRIKEEDSALLEQQQHELGEVQHALEKIGYGTYGICEKTLEPIPVERLKANPAARYKV